MTAELIAEDEIPAPARVAPSRMPRYGLRHVDGLVVRVVETLPEPDARDHVAWLT